MKHELQMEFKTVWLEFYLSMWELLDSELVLEQKDSHELEVATWGTHQYLHKMQPFKTTKFSGAAPP